MKNSVIMPRKRHALAWRKRYSRQENKQQEVAKNSKRMKAAWQASSKHQSASKRGANSDHHRVFM